MFDILGFKVGLYINKVTKSIPSDMYSFSISDNIYSAFPTVKITFADISGLYLELNNFNQGVPLNIKYGILAGFNMLDADFRTSCRDTVSPAVNSSGLNGTLEVHGIHDSFFSNRNAPNIALKEITVSSAVRKLFPYELKLFVETTKGNIESYAIDDPYQFTRDILLPQASNGKVRPFCFFRNLANELCFESINKLEEAIPSEILLFAGDVSINPVNMMTSFLPFNEGLEKTLINFHAEGKILKNDFSFSKITKNIATDAKCKIPVMGNTKIHHSPYFHRQFNPKVDYEQLNTAFLSDSMRSGFFVDKAMGMLPFHPNLVAGKTVQIIASLVDGDNKFELSETFSGKWLIEQSTHIWDGSAKKGQTQLILCRSSMMPKFTSKLMTDSFKG